MASKRKFYRSVITVEVLSEEPVSFGTLEQVHEAITDGDCCGLIEDEVQNEEIDAKMAADKLHEHGSEPGFFRLTDEGEDTDEIDDENHSTEEDLASPN
jgi:hypothetical protein